MQQEVYEIGITQVQSPQGGTVKVYDREQCICDLIQEKDQMDMQLYTQAIKDSFRSKPNNRKLLKYGKVFGIEEKIRIYMECYNENPGTVIGSMNGISERTTMDMDTTVRGIQMEEDEILLR